jgi:YfiH family protein
MIDKKQNQSQIYDGINSYGSFAKINPLLRLPLDWRFTAAPAGVRIFFTMRRGGVSPAPYDSLNLGFHVGDDPELVIRNRVALSEAHGIDPALVTSPRQRHTAVVELLEHKEQAGAGAFSEESVFDPCDGLATSLRRVPILLQFADCLPVVLAAAGARPAIAVLHGGRQGLMAGVVRNGVSMLAERLGASPECITAALGPAIGPCCYEVGPEIAAAFGERFGEEAVAGDDRVDLAAAAIVDLKAAGVRPANIHLLDICTACDRDFYSYRRDGVTGRHGALAWIE